MAISRKTSEPTGVTNASGQPEIVLEIEGLTISMAPPVRDQAVRDQAVRDQAVRDQAARDEDEPADGEAER